MNHYTEFTYTYNIQFIHTYIYAVPESEKTDGTGNGKLDTINLIKKDNNNQLIKKLVNKNI